MSAPDIESAILDMLKAQRLKDDALESISNAASLLRQIIPKDTKRRLVSVSYLDGNTSKTRLFLVSRAADLSPVIDEVQEWAAP